MQPWLSEGCLVSLALSKFHNTVDMPLSFILMQIKNWQAATQLCPPDLQLAPKWNLCWVTATWSLTAKQEQGKPQITFSNCIVSLMPHKRIEHSRLNSVLFLPFSLCIKYRAGTEWGVGRERRWAKPKWATTSSLSPMSCNETLGTFPLASFMLLLILWKHQKIWHL